MDWSQVWKNMQVKPRLEKFVHSFVPVDCKLPIFIWLGFHEQIWDIPCVTTFPKYSTKTSISCKTMVHQKEPSSVCLTKFCFAILKHTRIFLLFYLFGKVVDGDKNFPSRVSAFICRYGCFKKLPNLNCLICLITKLFNLKGSDLNFQSKLQLFLILLKMM